MIFVFLANKLISLDTILPLLLEFKRRAPDLRFEFICFEPSTEVGIRQNVVLFDVIQSLGSLRMLGRTKKGAVHSFLHRLWVLGPIARIALWLLHPQTRLVHFKALNAWPLSVLSWLGPSKTIFSQGSAVGFAALEKRASELMKERNYPFLAPAGKHIIMYSEHCPELEGHDLGDRIIHRLAPPFTLRSWLNYLKASEQRYLGEALSRAGLDPCSEFGVVILNWLGPSSLYKNPEDTPKLLEETFEALWEACPELPILIKPHPATRPRELAILDNMLAKFPRSRNIITHLHPMVLAMRARFVVGNSYSTTFSVFMFCQVPTIEYADYAEPILAETRGGSMRPEFVTHFINRDKGELCAVLKRYAIAVRSKTPISGAAPVADDVFIELTGRAPIATA